MKKHFYSFLAMLTAMFALSSCEDVPMPYDLPIFGGGGSSEGIAPAGTGSLDDPFNVEGVIAFIEAGEGLDEKVYIKGYVTSVKECSPSFGNATFYIASEVGGTNTFYVYRCNGLGGDKITSEDQIKEGDEVVVYGKVTDYNGTKETVQKEAFIYSINGKTGDGGDVDIVTGEPKGDGTQANPYNPVAVIGFINSLADNAKTENDVYIKGVISKVKECSAQYQNATFYITETGATNEADFYVYRCLGLGNKPIDSDTYVKEGDEVIICGKVTKYVSQYGATPETVQKEAYIYSLNGKVEGGGTTPDVTPGTPSGNGTIDTPFNVAAAIKKCEEVGDAASADSYYVTGIVSKLDTKYANTFFISDDGTTNNQLEFYNGVGIDDATLQNGDVNVGDIVVVYGQLQNYKGNTPELVKGCKIISLKKGTNGGNPGGGNTGDANINVDETFDVGSFVGVVESGKEINGISVGGLSFTADKGTNTNAPKFYSSNGFNTIRMYPTNTVTITFSKSVKNIAINCDTYQNIVCVAEGKGEASPGNATTIGDIIVVKDINSNTVTIKNGHTGTGTAAQIRIKTIGIEYSKANAKANVKRRK